MADNKADLWGSTAPAAPANNKADLWGAEHAGAPTPGEPVLTETEKRFEPVAAAIHGVAEMIPGVPAAAAWLNEKLTGKPQQESAQLQQHYDKNDQGSVLAGNAVGLGLGMLTGGGEAAAGGKLLQVGKAALSQGLKGAALQPVYRMGEVAHEAQLQASPLHVEQIAHAFDWKDMAEAGGIAAALGAITHGASALLGKAGPTLEKNAYESGERLLKKAPEKLNMSPRDLTEKAFNEDLFKHPEKAAAMRDAAGDKMGALISQLPRSELLMKDAATTLRDVAKSVEHLEPLEGVAARIAKQADNLEKSTNPKDLHDVAKLYREEATSALSNGKNQAGQLFMDARHKLLDVIGENLSQVKETAGREFKTANQTYRLYHHMAQALKSAPEQAGWSDIASHATVAAAGKAMNGLPGTAEALWAARQAAPEFFRKKSYVTLMKSISKVAPGDKFESGMNTFLDTLIPATTDINMSKNK